MSGKAKYYVIKEQIERLIETGATPVGSKLPPEPDLAEQFNASRGTVRQALSALAADGVIARRSGSGTYIIRLPDKDARILSFSEQMAELDRALETRVLVSQPLTMGQVDSSERTWLLRAFLLVGDAQALERPVYRIERLRLVDEKPVSWQQLYLLANDFRADLLQSEDFSQSAFEIYRRHGRVVSWAEESIQARRANAEAERVLAMNDLPKGERFIYIRRRVSYDSENLPVEAIISRERHDCFDSYRYRIVESREKFRTS